MLAARSTCPVAGLTKTKPAVDENVPATPPPLNVGSGFAAFWQYGVPSQLKVATGSSVTVRSAVVLFTGDVPQLLETTHLYSFPSFVIPGLVRVSVDVVAPAYIPPSEIFTPSSCHR